MFRIRINFTADPDTVFKVNADPAAVPDPYKGFR